MGRRHPPTAGIDDMTLPETFQAALDVPTPAAARSPVSLDEAPPVDGACGRPMRAAQADATAVAAPRVPIAAREDAPADDRLGRLKQASDAVAWIHKTHFGRGPRRCRTMTAAGDIVVCVVEGTLNVAELRLVELGEYERVRGARLFAIDASQDELRRVVGQAFERDVRLMVAGVDPLHDVTTLTFVLE